MKLSREQFIKKLLKGETEFSKLVIIPMTNLSESKDYERVVEYLKRGTQPLILEYSNLQGLIAPRMYFKGANLWEADLRGAYLEEADLREAYLGGANIWGACLGEADLGEADLRRANLGEVDLRRANLMGADLRGADLEGADLRGADLRGANLMEARYSLVQLSNIFLPSATQAIPTDLTNLIWNYDFKVSQQLSKEEIEKAIETDSYPGTSGMMPFFFEWGSKLHRKYSSKRKEVYKPLKETEIPFAESIIQEILKIQGIKPYCL